MIVIFSLYIVVLVSIGLHVQGIIHGKFNSNATKSGSSKIYWMKQALDYISSVQTPSNCSVHYIEVRIGVNGGFAAQFQLVAAEFMKALASGKFKHPVIITGRMKGYSEGEECKSANHEWTCFFEPTTKCHDAFTSSDGKKNEMKVSVWPSENDSIPKRFRHLGFVFWWGVIQKYLFRFKSFVNTRILDQARSMHDLHGFPFGLPIAGMHVRHGDKHIDGFTEHSLSEELALLRAAPDCMIKNDRDDCFYKIMDQQLLMNALYAAQQNQIVILRLEDIKYYNRTISNSSLTVDPTPILQAMKAAAGSSRTKPSSVHHHLQPISNSTTLTVNQTYHHHHHHHLLEQSSSYINGTYVIPLPLFVASDDPDVVKSADRRGYLLDRRGVSQQTSTLGMLTTLLKHKDYGFNATMEIICDIYFLSQCSTLFGMMASQVFRMSVALSNVTGTLKYAKATDSDQMERVKRLSRKYHVPFPETFH